MLPTVALVGRPNVGKSTLFNALTRTRAALVHDTPGVTRDNHVGVCRWQEDAHFGVIDTGGIGDASDALTQVIAKQARWAAAEADIVAVIVDAREGRNMLDDEIITWLRRLSTPIVLVINKIDGLNPLHAMADFADYGLEPRFAVSAAHRRGIDDLVAWLSSHLSPRHDALDPANAPTDALRVACVGRPNVGKSTLINRLLGEERVIASEVPGTTRDAIALPLQRDHQQYLWIDTAGLRRRARVDGAVETFSAIKTLQAIAQCQIAVLLLDAQIGVTDQDAHVLASILDAQRGLVVAVNKWDGLTTYQRAQTLSMLSRKFSFVPWVEIVKISAREGSGFKAMFQAISRAHASATRKITTSALNRALSLACQHHPPPSVAGQTAKLRYINGASLEPPTWIIHGTRLKSLPSSYIRYLENSFRAHFSLVGTPVRFVLREGENPYAEKSNPLTERQIRRRRRLIKHVKQRR